MLTLKKYNLVFVAIGLIALAGLLARAGWFQTTFLIISAALAMGVFHRSVNYAAGSGKPYRWALLIGWIPAILASAVALSFSRSIIIFSHYLSFSEVAAVLLFISVLAFVVVSTTLQNITRGAKIFTIGVYLALALAFVEFSTSPIRLPHLQYALPADIDDRFELSELEPNIFLIRDGRTTTAFRLNTDERLRFSSGFGSEIALPRLLDVDMETDRLLTITYEDRPLTLECGTSSQREIWSPLSWAREVSYEKTHPVRTKQLYLCLDDGKCDDAPKGTQILRPDAVIAERVDRERSDAYVIWYESGVAEHYGARIVTRAKHITKKIVPPASGTDVVF